VSLCNQIPTFLGNVLCFIFKHRNVQFVLDCSTLKNADVSRHRNALIFKDRIIQFLWDILTLEREDTTVPQNTGIRLPSDEHRNPEDRNPPLHRCENLRTPRYVVLHDSKVCKLSELAGRNERQFSEKIMSLYM
jgi:hypothetical protein